MLEHGVEHLVGDEELKLFVAQVFDELGVELDPLAIRPRRGAILTKRHGHVEGKRTNEGVVEDKAGTCLGKSSVEVHSHDMFSFVGLVEAGSIAPPNAAVDATRCRGHC